MNGTIYFDYASELAVFLKEFTGSTAIFEVKYLDHQYVLQFTGGY
jgi:hypothetical protein